MAKKYDKKAVPDDHWEVHYHMNVKKDTRDVMGAPFDPMRSKDRMTTYKKVNSTDH